MIEILIGRVLAPVMRAFLRHNSPAIAAWINGQAIRMLPSLVRGPAAVQWMADLYEIDCPDRQLASAISNLLLIGVPTFVAGLLQKHLKWKFGPQTTVTFSMSDDFNKGRIDLVLPCGVGGLSMELWRDADGPFSSRIVDESPGIDRPAALKLMIESVEFVQTYFARRDEADEASVVSVSSDQD